MARHRRTSYVFKKKAGHWKRFRGNPFKKHIVRGRRALKRNIAMGFYDKTGKFHPIRASSDYVEGYAPRAKARARGRRALKRAMKKTTRRKRHSKRRR